MAPGDEKTFRLGTILKGHIVAAFIWLALGIMTAFVAIDLATGDPTRVEGAGDVGSIRMYAFFTLVFWFLAAREPGVRVVVSSTGVRIHNRLRTRFISRSDIADVAVRKVGAKGGPLWAAAVVLRNGKARRATALTLGRASRPVDPRLEATVTEIRQILQLEP